MLFTDEVKNMPELLDKLSTIEANINKIKVGVVCFIFDQNDNLILHRRGSGARDQVGKVQALGGSVNSGDDDFRAALKRELSEEVGTKANITIDSFVGALLDGKVDRYSGEYIDWVILAYTGTLVDGELINAEPERCVGFERALINEFNEDDLSETAKKFIKQIIEIRK